MVDNEEVEVSENMPRLLHDELKHWSNEEKRNIEKEKYMNRNHPFAFLSTGDIGEELTLYMHPNSIGGCSKGGMAFDNKEIDENKETKYAREIKFVCLEGTKECKKCKYKCPRFQDKCLFCNGNDFKLMSDSRAGISVTAHVKYKKYLQEYIIFVMQFNEDKFIIDLKCFKFLSTNKYFDDYITNQYENGTGNTCNFIPYSYDWHLSGPIKIMDVDIDISDDQTKITTKFYDITSMIYEGVPKNVFNNEEIQKYNITKDYTNYDEIKEKNIPLRKKNLGKSRGTVTRK
tara:strand:+ start:174 stop:1037 length:864 start_codon:yes stop_codon:yes gene_type:complete